MELIFASIGICSCVVEVEVHNRIGEQSIIAINQTLSVFNSFLSRGHTCHFLLTLATRHPQSRSATEIEDGCMCSQVSPISATCSRKFNSMNVLQHCPSNLVAEPALATLATFWFHNLCNISKKCCVASASKNVPRVGAALCAV